MPSFHVLLKNEQETVTVFLKRYQVFDLFSADAVYLYVTEAPCLSVAS